MLACHEFEKTLAMKKTGFVILCLDYEDEVEVVS